MKLTGRARLVFCELNVQPRGSKERPSATCPYSSFVLTADAGVCSNSQRGGPPGAPYGTSSAAFGGMRPS
jgi:hypothetical protein